MKTLPDYLRKGMKLVIVGCNPSESSVRTGHYYSGRNNVFWPVLHQEQSNSRALEYGDDRRIIGIGIGLTDLVKRPTRGVEELTREDFAEGRILLSQKLEEYTPRVMRSTGKWLRTVCAAEVQYGVQKELLYGARVYVLPSSSGQNASGQAERLTHFRKLAQLVRRTEKGARDSVCVKEIVMSEAFQRRRQCCLNRCTTESPVLLMNRPERLNAAEQRVVHGPAQFMQRCEG